MAKDALVNESLAKKFATEKDSPYTRWVADEAQGRVYLSVLQGAIDASSRWTVTHSWEVWKTEVTWMSLYFSLAVWLSIALVHLPRLRAAPLRSTALRANLAR